MGMGRDETLWLLEGVDDRVLEVMADHADVCSLVDASHSSGIRLIIQSKQQKIHLLYPTGEGSSRTETQNPCDLNSEPMNGENESYDPPGIND